MIPSAASNTLAAFLVIALIYLNLQEGHDFFYQLLNSRALTYIGILSYSIYIWQQLFTYNSFGKELVPEPIRLALELIALGLTSYLSYEFFERRFLKLKERFR
jgi:peptidoglycan/LPS O-acetylase OafA/YrhL